MNKLLTMKKIITLFAACLFVGSAIAQNIPAKFQKTLNKSEQNQAVKNQLDLSTVSTNQLKSSKAGSSSGVDTIWASDFSDATEWSISNSVGNNADWVIGLGVPSGDFPITGIASTTAANGFALYDSDNYCNGNQDAFLRTTDPIDCSASSTVLVNFEQFYRRFTCETFVEVSTDGTAWTQFPVNTSLGANGSLINPTFTSVNVTAVAANQATVWVRFRFLSGAANAGDGCDYAWMVDDVSITTAPAYDLKLEQAYYDGRDSSSRIFYSAIPERQAVMTSVNFAADVYNIGSNDNSGVRLAASAIREMATIWSDTGSAVTIIAGSFDSLEVSNSFSFNQGQGAYTLGFNVISDSTDFDPSNNILNKNVTVGPRTYAWDNGNVTSGNWYNTNIWQMAVGFDFPAPDTVLAISCFFPTLTNNYTIREGDPISYYLYDENLDIVGLNEFYNVPANSANTFLSIPIRTPSGDPVAVDSGFYYAAFKIYTPETAIASNSELNASVPDGLVLVELDQDGSWGFTNTLLPFVRVITADPNACQGVTMTMTETTTEFDPSFEGSIDLAVSGGTPPYSFTWSTTDGQIPSGQTNSQNLSGITVQGTYHVTASDLFGCLGTKSISISGTVSTNDIVRSSIEVYPNPNTGAFIIDTKGLEGLHTVRIQNLLGKTVYDKNLNLSGNRIDVDLSEFGKGIYVLNVINTSDESVKAAKIVVK